MFNFNNVVKFENKRFDVFAIGELLVDMISDDYDADNSSLNTQDILVVHLQILL